MLRDYAPILVLLALAAGFALVNIGLSELVGRTRRAVGKSAPYECGMEAQGDARVRLSIHFYLVAVLFILFDVEALFLVPWAVAARSLAAVEAARWAVFLEVAGFAAVLGLGLAYVWRKGGLAWDR